MVSLTQSTELGTLYALDELRALSAVAHAGGPAGARRRRSLCQRRRGLGCRLPELVAAAGIDLLSFGGTKNGLMLGEAVVVFDQELVPGMLHLRKQTLQLASKMRFVAAQFDALLTDELWLENASHANAMAARLFAAVSGIEGVEVTRPPAANAVFAILPPQARERLQQEFDFYEWDDATARSGGCAPGTPPSRTLMHSPPRCPRRSTPRRRTAVFVGRRCVRCGTQSLGFSVHALT